MCGHFTRRNHKLHDQIPERRMDDWKWFHSGRRGYQIDDQKQGYDQLEFPAFDQQNCGRLRDLPASALP